jgi:2'-5' RNA ligase
VNTASRYFLALLPDAGARARLSRVALSGGARRVAAQDLHLTLAFLGTLNAESPGALLAALAGSLPGPIDVSLDALENWEGSRVACAVGACPKAQDLAQALWVPLRRLGYTGPDKPLRPHVTLARGLRRPLSAGSALVPPVAWRSGELVLMASLGGALPGEPRYRQLGSLALSG